MKILFICGSLSLGEDGVGDYTRIVAGKVIEQGLEARIIALFDKKVNCATYEQQKQDNEQISVLRIPASATSALRYENANLYVKKFDPLWVSIQYVPFSFNRKGITLSLVTHLKKMCIGRKLHFMFHELWVGREENLLSRQGLLSIIQELAISYMISATKPIIVHTHLPIYRNRLQNKGIDAKELPLFSNIPFVISKNCSDENIIRIAVFSQADAHPQVIDFLKKIKETIIQAGKLLEILLLGGNRERMQRFENDLKFIESNDCIIKNAGFLSPKELSCIFQICSMGLTSLPRHSIGKSGSVAAFFEHNLPVAAPVVTLKTSPFFKSELNNSILLEPNLEQLKRASSAAATNRNLVSPLAIASKFIQDLS